MNLLKGMTGICLMLVLQAGGKIQAQDTPPAEKSVNIVRDKISDYSIYFESGAPSSVKLAADELQRVISISSGVKLPIVNQPRSPMICLGDNLSAAAVCPEKIENLPDESFCIITKDRNIYIAGKDTADNFKWKGWESKGTLFGAYDFLERAVGVHWLMPGDIGEEIPSNPSLSIPEMSLKCVPDFNMRRLGETEGRRPADVYKWMTHQKLQLESKLEFGHNWTLITSEDYKAHPEYLAVGGTKGKFCTSNPEVVALFAQRVMDWFEKNPDKRGCSITPEDGGEFCQCPKCFSQTTTDPHGKNSYTPVILKFYNDVARIVGKKYPDRLLDGAVYYNYMYPPEKPVKMEPNIYLDLWPLNYYGWGLCKPAYRDEFKKLVPQWMQMTDNFKYGNYSTWMRSLSGAPVPPGFEILKLELPTLHKLGVKGVDYIVGISAWGYGALGNYILAKQLWKADIDVDAVSRDWLETAYGPAWKTMEDFYRLTDSAMLEFKSKETRGITYNLLYDFIEKVYKPIFPQMENLYKKALTEVRTEKQRRRLEMLGVNLVKLHYNMNNAGLINEPEKSIFYRSDADYKKLMSEAKSDPVMLLALGNLDDPPLIRDGLLEGTRKLAISRIPKDAKPPVIDGDISDSVWQYAAVADTFRIFGRSVPAKQQTSARLIYDNDNLYIAFMCCSDLPTWIKKTVPSSHRDSIFIFEDDCLEIVLAVFPDNSSKFWHLGLNAANAQWDGIAVVGGPNPAGQNLEWKSGTRITENGWEAEIAIPFKSLGLNEAPSGITWRANLGRCDYTHNEFSAWKAVYRSLLERDSYGEWKFEK